VEAEAAAVAMAVMDRELGDSSGGKRERAGAAGRRPTVGCQATSATGRADEPIRGSKC